MNPTGLFYAPSILFRVAGASGVLTDPFPGHTFALLTTSVLPNCAQRCLNHLHPNRTKRPLVQSFAQRYHASPLCGGKVVVKLQKYRTSPPYGEKVIVKLQKTFAHDGEPVDCGASSPYGSLAWSSPSQH